MMRFVALLALLVAIDIAFAQMTFTDNWKRGAFAPHVFRGWQNAKDAGAENPLNSVSGVCSPESLLSELRELKHLQQRQVEIVASIAKCAERSL